MMIERYLYGTIKTAALVTALFSVISARTFSTYTADIGAETSASESELVAVVNNPSASVGEKIDALDVLSTYADPHLFPLFKDIAFRSTDKTLRLHTVALLGSFAATYCLPEMCDTLTDIIRNNSDTDLRFAALMCLKDIAPSLPCDRNKIIDALLSVVAPQTYSRDARLFFNAVPFLVDMAAQSDKPVLDMLDYLKFHYEEYIFDNLIDATDAFKTFTNSIGKTYSEKVRSQDLPAQINDMIPDAVTKDYITVIAFMLDSVATDSLGMAAITWLLQNGGNDNGDEGERLGYLAMIAAAKRPDKSTDILAALQPVLQKYGVHNRVPVPTVQGMVKEVNAVINTADGTVIISNLTPQSRITVFSINGRRLFDGYCDQTLFTWRTGRSSASMHYIVTVNRVPVRCSISR